ncbi:prepilin-type N-terminal cleavage/methylation domain-containing protein [Chloroflexota bacterium]
MNILTNQKGLTLLELLLSMAVGAMITVGIVALISHEFKSTGTARTYVSAAHEISIAASKISQDVMMTESTDLVNGANSIDQVTLSWIENLEFSDIPHSCQYYLDGTQLIRAYDGNLSTVAKDISNVTFLQNDRVMTVSITCHPQWWNSKSVERTYRIYLRPAEEI